MDFVRWLSEAANVSVVLQEDLDERELTIDLRDVPLSRLLALVSRRLGVQVTKLGTVYYIGNLGPEDRGYLVRKVRRLDPESLDQAAAIVMSELGEVVVMQDGVAVFSDRVEALTRLGSMLDEVETAELGFWLVQFHLINIDRRNFRELGLDVTPLLEISARMATGGGASQFDAVAGFDAILRAAANNEAMTVKSAPLFVMRDGGISSISNTRDIPVPLRTTSDEGTVTTDGFEIVSIGTTINLTLREATANTATVNVQLEQSQLAGFVESAPIKVANRFSTEAPLASGGVYLLGSMSTDSTRDSIEGPVKLTFVDEDDASIIQIWCRVMKIEGEARRREGPPRPGEGPDAGPLLEDLRDIKPLLDQLIADNIETAARQPREW